MTEQRCFGLSEIVDRIKAYTERYGIVKLCGKIVEKGTGYVRNIGKTETEKQIHEEYTFARNPLISIIVPVYNVEHEAFKATLESVLAQTYGNWELCVADGGENKVDAVIDEVMGDDARIRYVSLEANLGISGNSNQALDVASGEYVAFLDHDDILEPDALYEAANRIVNYGADMVYTDEDKVSPDLKRYFKPYRKPDYNKTLLLSNNYICHFCVINRKIVTEAGGFRSEYDGAQDYDLVLRIVSSLMLKEKENSNSGRVEDYICHVPKVLYHWRCHEGSTADNPQSKMYAYEAGRKALADFTFRMGWKADIRHNKHLGFYRIAYRNDVLIHREDLAAVGGFEDSGWPKIEVVRKEISDTPVSFQPLAVVGDIPGADFGLEDAQALADWLVAQMPGL